MSTCEYVCGQKEAHRGWWMTATTVTLSVCAMSRRHATTCFEEVLSRPLQHDRDSPHEAVRCL